MALQQAARACRGSARADIAGLDPLQRDLFLLLEACAADSDLIGHLPGMRKAVNAMRLAALAARPALAEFAEARIPLERLVRAVLETDCGEQTSALPASSCPAESIAL